MVHPINPIVAPATVNPALPGLQRPAPPPEPALRVSTVSGVARQHSATSSPLAGDAGKPTPVDRVLDELNSGMQAWATDMRFEIDPDTRRLVVSVIDKSSGETLRTMPTEAVLRIAKMIVKLQGLGVDTRA